ncbi:Uncharacterised protein [Streptococcus pneumoniae]|nr:Uncharacterised protein [Streptococcus pneumoniae]
MPSLNFTNLALFTNSFCKSLLGESTISLTGYLTFQKNYNVKINYTVSNSFK